MVGRGSRKIDGRSASDRRKDIFVPETSGIPHLLALTKGLHLQVLQVCRRCGSVSSAIGRVNSSLSASPSQGSAGLCDP